MTSKEAARFLEIVKHYEGKLIPVDQLTIEAIDTAIKALENKPTNGDMIKAMFPSVAIRVVTESQMGISFFNNQNEITWTPSDWWNAPYKRGNEE